MNDSLYDEVRKDIRQIFVLIDKLAEMHSVNERNIKTANDILYKALEAIYSIQNTKLAK